MNDFKERIINIGLKYSKVAELLGMSRSHLCRVLNERAFFSEETSNRLDHILTQYENIEL